MATSRGPAKGRTQPLTFADLAARIRRPRRITELVLDGDAAARVDALAELLDRARERDEVLGGTPTAPVIARQLQQAEAAADASRVEIVFEAIPHTEYKALQAKYPATPEQRAGQAEGGEQWSFDPDAFAPVLVRAAMIDPQPPGEEEFAAFWNALSDGQIRQLWTTALGAQMQITTLAPRSESAAEVLRAAAS